MKKWRVKTITVLVLFAGVPQMIQAQTVAGGILGLQGVLDTIYDHGLFVEPLKFGN